MFWWNVLRCSAAFRLTGLQTSPFTTLLETWGAVFGCLVQPLKNVNAELVYSSWRSLSQRGPWCLPGVTSLPCVDPLVQWYVVWFVALQWNIVVYKSVNILRMHDVNCQTSTDRLGRVLVRRHLSEFLANVNSRSRSLYAVACPSFVCLSSVTFVRPTQEVQIFGNISTALGTLAIHWHPLKIFVEIVQGEPNGNPPPGELNTRGVAKYSDFGPIDGYISETVQDRR